MGSCKSLCRALRRGCGWRMCLPVVAGEGVLEPRGWIRWSFFTEPHGNICHHWSFAFLFFVLRWSFHVSLMILSFCSSFCLCSIWQTIHGVDGKKVVVRQGEEAAPEVSEKQFGIYESEGSKCGSYKQWREVIDSSPSWNQEFGFWGFSLSD